MHVLVRPPSPSFRLALSEHPERDHIDPDRALVQHRGFVAALRRVGARLVELPPEPDLPDAPFVSDTVLALPPARQPDGSTSLVVLTRPGHERRRREVATVAECVRRLAPPRTPIRRIAAPGTLDGGDVIVFGDRVAIGVSARTDQAGAAQLARATGELGYRAFFCPVTDRLHLASAVTVLGPHRLVGTRAGFASLDAAGPDVAPLAEVERLVVPDHEVVAANVLSLNGSCFIAAGCPGTVRVLREAGERVVELELDEFAKADGGPTCLVGLVP